MKLSHLHPEFAPVFNQVEVKLNPVRLCIPRYGNGLMLLMEYLAKYGPMPTGIFSREEFIEIKLPVTKHGIRPIKEYINQNLSNN